MEPPPKWPLIFLHLGFHTFSGEPSPLSKSRSSSMSPALPMITTQSYFGKIMGTSFWKNGTSVEKTSGNTEKKKKKHDYLCVCVCSVPSNQKLGMYKLEMAWFQAIFTGNFWPFQPSNHIQKNGAVRWINLLASWWLDQEKMRKRFSLSLLSPRGPMPYASLLGRPVGPRMKSLFFVDPCRCWILGGLDSSLELSDFEISEHRLRPKSRGFASFLRLKWPFGNYTLFSERLASHEKPLG